MGRPPSNGKDQVQLSAAPATRHQNPWTNTSLNDPTGNLYGFQGVLAYRQKSALEESGLAVCEVVGGVQAVRDMAGRA